MTESKRLTLDDVVAIDFHTHVEMSEAGVDSLPDELRDAAVRHFRGESARPTAVVPSHSLYSLFLSAN